MSGLSGEEIVRLLSFGLIGLYVSVLVIRLFRGRLVTGALTLLVWIAALLAVVTGYSYRTELQGVVDRVMATVVPGLPIDSGPREETVLRSSDGQFLVRGVAQGVRLAFILDTGASAVVLQAEDAARLGIDTRRLVFDAEVSTANGSALTAEAILPDLAVGKVHESNVPVLVARPGALRENLLGMSFLNRLASYSVVGNKLILRGR